MTKPEAFREQRISRVETHYKVQEGFPKGSQSGVGILTPGRVIWVQNQSTRNGSIPTTAFAEGIGVVAVDPQSF